MQTGPNLRYLIELKFPCHSAVAMLYVAANTQYRSCNLSPSQLAKTSQVLSLRWVGSFKRKRCMPVIATTGVPLYLFSCD